MVFVVFFVVVCFFVCFLLKIDILLDRHTVGEMAQNLQESYMSDHRMFARQYMYI